MANYLKEVFLVVAVVACIGEGSAEQEKRDANEWSVTTLVEKPYLVTKATPPSKNDDFEGYIPDMMEKIGAKLNQKYKLRLVGDGRYGAVEGGRWSGMIGEVKDGSADLAAAPITISSQRSAVVDFTEPFMTFGTVVLLRKPANASMPVPKSLHDLINNDAIRYGVIEDGTTDNLITASSDQDLSLMKTRIERVVSQEKGVEKVRASKDGKFVFVLEEQTALFWKKQAPCDLTDVPISALKKRDYAFALKKGSANTAKINEVIKEMKEAGELDALKEKWWHGECSGGVGDASRVSGTLALFLAAMATLTAGFLKF
jgi:ABC-type amino acid transport substrate-binding protein